MREVLEAIAKRLRDSLGVTVGIGDMTGERPPFISLWGTPRGRETDPGLTSCGAWSKSSGMTVTTESVPLAVDLADAAIELLMPSRTVGTFRAGRQLVSIEFLSAQNAAVDRQVVLPKSNTHPAYITVQFRLHSQPLEDV